MYAVTYIGRMFNGLTLVIGFWLLLFSAPKVYKDNQVKSIKFPIESFRKKKNLNFQVQIDEALKPIKEKVDELLSKLKATKQD